MADRLVVPGGASRSDLVGVASGSVSSIAPAGKDR
jgi:hypothetical protein